MINAAEYGYAAADLFDSDISGHVQKDGLHPDQEGQRPHSGYCM